MSTQSPGRSDPTDRTRPAFTVPWSGTRAAVDVVAIYVLSLVAGQLVVSLALGGGLSRDDIVPALVLLSPIALLAVGLGWLRVRYPGALGRLRGPAGFRVGDVGVGVGLGVAAFVGQRLFVGAVALVAEQFGAELPQVQETFRNIAGDPRTAPVLVVTAILLAPVAEEVLFRGVLFQGLARRGFWVAAFASAGAFTVAHLEIGSGLLANALVVAGILPLGLVFAAVFARRGSLLAVVVAHSTFNALGVALLIGFGDRL